MPIANIIDKRSNSYNVNVSVAYEPSWHDNTCQNATQFDEPDSVDFDIEIIANTTVGEAIAHATKWPELVTLYIYDIGAL